MSNIEWDFSREDERPDGEFYRRERMVPHLDSTARMGVEHVIRHLATRPRPRILDLMASWDSHLPPELEAAEVVGLGMNQAELAANLRLGRRVIHDLNADPRLPFSDASFDLVLNVVSVDYLTDPVAVLREVSRVLRPGGILAVIFSNRWFEPKVTKVWKRSSDPERVMLVEEWLREAGGFGEAKAWSSRGLPRPADDKYAHLGIPSDPIYAVYARRQGDGDQALPVIPQVAVERPDPDQVEARKARVAERLECPYCGQRMKKWEVPQTPFTEWDNEYMYICFNDYCPYTLGGWQAMSRQGNLGTGYRLMFNPDQGSLIPVPVTSPKALRDGIVDEDEAA